ncbi:MAG TPA: cytochrome c biogenesis protein CcsA [Alphaproteobacteria bacterium]
MPASIILSLGALAALVPASILAVRRGAPPRTEPGALFWLLLLVAVAGPLAWTVAQLGPEWHTGFSTALWVTVAASAAVFAALTLVERQAWRLTPLVLAYLFLVGVIAMLWQHAPERPLPAGVPASWLGVHIASSVLTYALLTVAAAAGLAVLLQERALKARRPTALTHLLPSVADCDRIQVRLLIASEIVLGIGLVTGIATLYLSSGRLLAFDHKTLFSILAFVVIGGLLAAHRHAGFRGRRAAHFILLGYLLLSLAYPGVKFVTDVLLA